MNDTTTQDPAAIERDIRRTQEDMSRTVDRIGDQLTFRNIFNALLDKADENDVDARMLVDGARRNPIALGLIAAGAIWLVSDKDSKIPSFGSGKSKDSDELDVEGSDIHHRDYVSHMATVEMREGEDPLTYQRRRDVARANFFMLEPRHEEDEHSFRQRLDEMADKFREKRRAWSESSSQAGSSAKRKARQAAGKTQDMYESHPLVGGILAAAIGAAVGSTLPISRKEQEKLGRLGEEARDAAEEQKDRLKSQLRDKKDEMVDKADQKLQPADAGGQPNQGRSEGPRGGSPQSEGPFIIGDRDR